MMERLSFEKSQPYDGLEAAIHVARYSFAKQLCARKRVLDAACGEGYGARLLADWGAAEVVGVDISAESVGSATYHFSNEKVSFLQSDAESLASRFEPHSFDLIVSFETIEHVSDPELFLKNIQTLLKPGGVVAISCPNDWWYYPTEAERNPFHMRKFHLEEFQQLTESILGKVSAWFVGGMITGFTNVQLGKYRSSTGEGGQLQMMRTTSALEAMFVPAETDAGPGPKNGSYFLGVWGAPGYADVLNAGTAILPLSMDSLKNGIFQGHLPIERANRVRPDNVQHAAAIDVFDTLASTSVDRLVRDTALRAEAAFTELALLQELVGKNGLSVSKRLQAADDEIRRLNALVDELSLPAARYFRLRDMLPHWARSAVLKVLKKR